MMKLYQIIGILLIVVCPDKHTSAQQFSDIKDAKSTNLFNYGESLTSSEVNLKNLFSNFPEFIKNANEIDLLNYKYIGKIKNRKQAEQYIKKNFLPDLPAWTRSYTTENNTTTITLGTERTFAAENRSKLKEIIKTISDTYVHTGYEIYAINFVLNLKSLRYYIFINPETKQVVTQGNIFAIETEVPNR